MTMPTGSNLIDEITRTLVLRYGNANDLFLSTTLLGRARAEILRGRGERVERQPIELAGLVGPDATPADIAARLMAQATGAVEPEHTLMALAAVALTRKGMPAAPAQAERVVATIADMLCVELAPLDDWDHVARKVFTALDAVFVMVPR